MRIKIIKRLDKFLNNEQRVETAISLISQLYVCIKETVGSDEANEIANTMLGSAIILGTEGNATADEKFFIDQYIEKLGSGIKDEEVMYSGGIDDTDYNIAKTLTSNVVFHEWAMLYLRLILCIAYSDAKFGDEVASKLEGIYSAVFVIEFANSGLESVPAPTVGLYGLELEIAKDFLGSDQPGKINDICNKFPGYSCAEIETALDSLCKKRCFTSCQYSSRKFLYSFGG